MDFSALDDISNEILQDAAKSQFPASDALYATQRSDSSEEGSDVELDNSFSPVLSVKQARTGELNETGNLNMFSELPTASTTSKTSPRATSSNDIDNFSEEATLNETLSVLEAVVPVLDRRLYSIISTLKESRYPSRTNSTSLNAYTTNISGPEKREDLLKRLFSSESSSSESEPTVEAVLLRDLMCEELKHCSRLQSLQRTVIEPLEAQIRDGRCNWLKLSDHATMFQNFSMVANAQFDHACALTKAMATWPHVTAATGLFQTWVFAIPLYAELAQTLNYSTQLLLHLQTHPLSKKAFRHFLASREAEPRLAARSSIFMPVPDLLNEPFNHLPKYQFFIESLLSAQSRALFSPRSDPLAPPQIPSPHSAPDVHLSFTQSCQTLAILQQSLTYLTKCYHHSENMSRLRKLVDRLGSEAPNNLRNYEQRKVYGGDDMLVYITDHRRKRRKRGFVIILSDSLLLVRCADLSSISTTATTGGNNSTSPSPANRRSMAPITFSSDPSPTAPPSVPVDSKAAKLMGVSSQGPSSETKAQKKLRKEADKKAKKLERSTLKAASKPPPLQPLVHSSSSESLQRAHHSGLGHSDSISSFNRPGNASAPLAAQANRSRFSSAISTPILPSSAPTGQPHPLQKSPSVPLVTGISKSLAQSCPLRFIALLFFDQLGLQMDAVSGDPSEAPTVVIWAFDTKFTVEFEQQEHKQTWLNFVTEHMRRGSAKAGPFGKSLAELYSQPSRGIPSSVERFAVLDEFLMGLESNPAVLEHAVPPFVAWLFDSVVSSFSSNSLDGDMIIRAPIPPRNDSTWKTFKHLIIEDWNEVQLSNFPPGFVLTLLCLFCSKLPEPLIPNKYVELIASKWSEEDCTDPNKIKRLIQQLPAFNLYTLGYLCQALNQIIRVESAHQCSMNEVKIPNISPINKHTSDVISTTSKRKRATRDSLYQVPKMSPSALMDSILNDELRRASTPSSTSPFNASPSPRETSADDIPKLQTIVESESGPNKLRSVSPSTAGTSTSSDNSSDTTPRVSVESGGTKRDTSSTGAEDDVPKLSCTPTFLALLLSASLAPTIVRPFKLRTAKPVAVGNFIGRLPIVVRFFACLIDHAPQIFAPLKRISTVTVISSFEEIKAKLQAALFIPPIEVPNDVSDVTTGDFTSIGIGNNSSTTVAEGRRQRDARRGAAIFNFDMSGFVTETFSVMDFSSLHFALTPPDETF